MLRYLTLEEIKKQCNIDQQFTEDDEYLQMIGEAAEDMTAKLVNCNLDELEADCGGLPATIRHAMRILCDYFYSVNRGSSENTPEIPSAVNFLLKLYFQFR